MLSSAIYSGRWWFAIEVDMVLSFVLVFFSWGTVYVDCCVKVHWAWSASTVIACLVSPLKSASMAHSMAHAC
jgi:hypothetical protein